jgi:hypothetical protein
VASVPTCPIFNRIASEAPKLRGARGDLKPMVADEEEVVRSRRQPVKVSTRNDVPTENTPKYLRREECSSNARMELRLISRSIAVQETASEVVEYP